ncbi:MAG: Gldg family protein [Planctomycetota bacterium]
MSTNQNTRRAKYGLNVAIAVAVAVALVVVVNALVDWQVRQLPAGAKSWLRYDLTATRAYTLAPQTQKLLSELKDELTLTAILRVDDKNGQDVADLLEEYADASNRLDIELIHPDRDLSRLENFYRQVEERFADETAPLEAAVTTGLEHLDQLSKDVSDMKSKIDTVISDDAWEDTKLRQEFQLLSNKLGEVQATYANAGESLSSALNDPMPPWSNARADLLNALQKADNEVLTPFSREFARRAKDRNAPLAARDTLLRMDALIEAAREPLREAVQTLTAPPRPTRYDRVQASLRLGEVIVILGPERERIIPVAEMFTAPSGDSPAAFIGEDRLTGTLVAMQITQPPLVVFVRDTPVSVTHPRGGYAHVTSRLATADFAITEWAIGGSNDPRNPNQAAVAPPPSPAEGQRAVWIVPTLSLERTTQADRELIADVLKKRLAAGDGVLLCFSYDPEAQFRPTDPLTELAGAWGLAPQTHKLLLHEGLGPDGRPRSQAAWLVRDWPSDSPLGGALAGREVQLIAPTPIKFEPRPKVVTQSLVELTQPKIWSATGLTTPEEIADSAFDPELEVTRPVVAATASATTETGNGADGRLMVFTERHWMSDQQAGRRLGNSELFMNSTYWLAGLDEAIAATPRSQDIRRIDALSDGQQLTYRLVLLAGLPGVTLLAGVGVWFVRRRG